MSVNATINRVSASHLDDKSPTGSVNDMENGKCIPNPTEQMAQRANYITLVQRVIVENVHALILERILCRNTFHTNTLKRHHNQQDL